MYSISFETGQRASFVSTAPRRSPFEHSAFDSQPLYIQALTNSIALSLSHPQSAAVSPADSHTSKELHIYIKTMAFKPFRDTYLREAFSQTLLNHILPKIGWGEGVTSWHSCFGAAEAPVVNLPRSLFCATFHGSER